MPQKYYLRYVSGPRSRFLPHKIRMLIWSLTVREHAMSTYRILSKESKDADQIQDWCEDMIENAFLEL